MVKRAKTFDELYKNRLKWVETSEDNGFNEGILKLLTELYPDKAHFVYELLQNAEDAKATSVSFQLYPDRLEFVHNGSRLFSLDDIDSITSIANTTKTKEDHTIGKFGVGFKAVFSYTQTPQIRSGDWNFEIERLVIPAPLEPIKGIDQEKTYFTFPFNNPKKTPEKAYIETKIGLEKLPPETLLFLNNIQELTWTIKDEEHKISKKEQDHIVSLYVDDNTKPIVQYLRFTKNNITLVTSNGVTEHLSVALAYKLEEDGDKKLKIVPISPSEHNVFIYFPAEKEDSELRFLINAPFDSEVSRASIRDTDDNALLIKEIVDLQIETMEYLRDNGYLTTEFLGVLPNSEDGIPDMYKIFHDELVKLFNTENYTPTRSGKFRPASELYKGSSMYTNGPHIAEFINDEELKEMLEAKDGKCEYVLEIPLWVRNTLQNSPADLFLQDLDLNEFGVEELYEWFDNGCNNGEQKQVWKSIIEQKDFAGLARLYRMLLQYLENNENASCWSFRYFPIFRCTDGKMYALRDDLFIQPENGWHKELLDYYHFIDNKSFGVSQQKSKILELFKDYFGIEEFSIETLDQEKFERLISKYSQNDLTTNDISISKHIEDIKFLLQYYENRCSHTMGYFEIQNKLEEVSFILTTDNRYVSVARTYSDMRYGNDNDLMKEAKDILDLSEINIKYKEKLSGKQVNEFIDMINSIGVRKQLWYIPCKDNPQKKYASCWYTDLSSETEDYDIYSLQEIIDNVRHNPKLSKLIWLSILSFPDWLAREACYRRNRRYDREFMPMQYVYTLSKSAWILDRNGYLQKPEDMTFDDLPINENWKRPAEYYEHPILKAIGFGKNTQQQREEQQRKDQVAKSVGFENAHEVEELKKLRDEMKEAGVTNEEVRNFILRRQEKGNKPLPESASKNPERRQVKVSDEYENASEQVYETKERSVRVSDTQVRRDARQYLMEEYTNEEDGEMICQMCQQELPFKKKDGQYYFETTQIFSNMSKEEKRQYLALCPNCAAEYDEWVRKDEKMAEYIRNKIAERRYIKGEKFVELNFSIHNEPHTMYFTGTHYLDLRSVLFPNIDNNINQTFWVSLENENIILQIGDIVRSEHFGEGKVVNIFDDTVEVQFSDGKKRINRDYLEKKE